MWKKIYHKLNIYHKTLSIHDYCIAFLKLINHEDDIWNIEELEAKLAENQSLDFFPEIINLHKYFNEGNYQFIANYIYYFPKTNKSWFDIDNNWDNIIDDVQYKKIFDDSSELYLLNKAIFKPEELLAKDELNRQLTFLFLLFLPSIDNYGMFYHHSKKIPLICCHGVSNDNFDMIYFLMNEYDKFEIDLLSTGKNLNHILMEDFMQNASELYSFDPNTNWNKIIPLYKIHKLLDINCGFKLFENNIQPNLLYMFEDMPKMLIKIEKEYLYSKFNEHLAKKEFKKETFLKL